MPCPISMAEIELRSASRAKKPQSKKGIAGTSHRRQNEKPRVDSIQITAIVSGTKLRSETLGMVARSESRKFKYAAEANNSISARKSGGPARERERRLRYDRGFIFRDLHELYNGNRPVSASCGGEEALFVRFLTANESRQ